MERNSDVPLHLLAVRLRYCTWLKKCLANIIKTAYIQSSGTYGGWSSLRVSLPNILLA